jgi:hypothetical protein
MFLDINTSHLLYVVIHRHSRRPGCGCYVVGLEGGGGYATEPPVEDADIFSCDSPGESKAEDDIVVGSVGSKPAAKAHAGSIGKEPIHIY